jgi:hypothetical protein
MIIMDNEKMPKNAKNYSCLNCNFKCSKKSNYLIHLDTRKHKMIINDNEKMPKNAEYICNCGNTYKYKSGLWKHKKNCNFDYDTIKDNDLNDKDLIMLLIKENSELKNMMMKVIENGTYNNNNNITNTNSHNSFNLQFFLNETCKNAMNITEFVESIKLQLSDLINVGEIGYVEGISNIIIKNLNSLQVTERPIHCTDKKRETFYVKDENKWEKENKDKKKIRDAIKKISSKNQKLILQYREKYPGCNLSDNTNSFHYNKMVIEAMGGPGNNDVEKEDKIIKNISKVTTIEDV